MRCDVPRFAYDGLASLHRIDRVGVYQGRADENGHPEHLKYASG